MSKEVQKTARRSVLRLLLLAWCSEAQGRDKLTWGDAVILAGLGLGWLLEKHTGKKSE